MSRRARGPGRTGLPVVLGALVLFACRAGEVELCETNPVEVRGNGKQAEPASREPLVTWPDGRTLEGRQRPLVIELPPGVTASLAVYVDGHDVVPEMAGRTVEEEGRLLFHPRWPWSPGVGYRAVLTSEDGAHAFHHRFPERLSEPSARVVAVHPTAAVLPANVLRFYVHFSAPMSVGEASEKVYFLDENGERLEDTFLDLDSELWDRERRRLTILLDPGRIKRGLRPHDELGAPLDPDRAYRLVVDETFQDAKGARLVERHVHSFRTTQADRVQPTTDSWTIEPPRAGTREPFHLAFPEPLDDALLGRMIRVLDPSGQDVPGELDVAADGTSWSLRPVAAWRAGVHELAVDPALEDLAGNNLARPFEVLLGRESPDPMPSEPVRLTFDLVP